MIYQRLEDHLFRKTPIMRVSGKVLTQSLNLIYNCIRSINETRLYKTTLKQTLVCAKIYN